MLFYLSAVNTLSNSAYEGLSMPGSAAKCHCAITFYLVTPAWFSSTNIIFSALCDSQTLDLSILSYHYCHVLIQPLASSCSYNMGDGMILIIRSVVRYYLCSIRALCRAMFLSRVP